MHDDTSGAGPEPGEPPALNQADGAGAPGHSAGGDVPAGANAGPAGAHFAEAVAMLARLPLTDAERADAVRRLLAGQNLGPQEIP